MDAVIRFCFLKDATEIECPYEYAKLFGQAKFIYDAITIMPAMKAMQSM